MANHGHVAGAVGERLKEARSAAGMSQRELAFPGCTAVYLCRIERGQRVPSLQVLHELARRLDVNPAWLATGEGPLEPPFVLELDAALIDECLRRVTRDKAETGLADLTDAEREQLLERLRDKAEGEIIWLAVEILSERPTWTTR